MNQLLSRQSIEVAPAFLRYDEADALALYDHAAAIVPMGAFECDLATNRLSWTSRLFDIFGFSRDHAVEREATVAMYSEESRALLDRKRSHAIRTRSGFTLDANVIRPDGEERWIRITAAVRGANGRSEILYGMKQDITEEHARWEALRAQAECDPLTGVANRLPFQRFLEQPDDRLALECGALMLFDLDGFKRVNDWWGHAAGDACLVAFGDRLRKAFPQASLISRIGGDEFAVLLPPVGSRSLTEASVRRAIAGLIYSVAWESEMLPLNASVGLAFASEELPLDPQALFASADRALYDAKHRPSTVLVCA